MTTDAKSQIIRFESRENEAYPDPVSGGDPWTIGIGHTGPEVHEGLIWDDNQIDFAFQLDFGYAWTSCMDHFPWFAALNEPRKSVLINMVFQMGLTGVLAFQKALDAMRDERWATAAEELRQSRWVKQTPDRCKTLARQMEIGEWQ